MKTKTLVAIIFDFVAFCILAAIMLVKDGHNENIIEHFITNWIYKAIIYFILLREMYRLMSWQKRYFPE